MLKIRGISNAENLLSGVNRFGHCLTRELTDFLPWHFMAEFKKRETDFLKRGGKFVSPMPEVHIVS